MAITRPEKNAESRTELIQTLRTGRVFSMTGAGLSAWAGYPVWSQLLDRLEARVRQLTDGLFDTVLLRRRYGNMPLKLAGELGKQMGDEFLPFLRAAFGPEGSSGLDPVLMQFASLPIQHHLSLNYDNSLERAHLGGLQTCGSLSSADRRSLIEFLLRCNDPTYQKKTVHFHGLFSDPIEGLILTEPGYAALYGDIEFYKRVCWTIFATRRLLFVGFGFTDEDFLGTLKDWKRDTRIRGADLTHFAIYGLGENEDDEEVRARLAEDYRIDCVFYNVLPNHDHREFTELIRGIAETMGTYELQRPELLAAENIPVSEEDATRIEELTRTMLNRTEGGLPDV